MNKELQKYLYVHDVCTEYGIDPKTQQWLRYTRQIKYTKLGKYVAYQRIWIENYIQSNIVEPSLSK